MLRLGRGLPVGARGAAADSRTSTRRQMSMMRQKLQRDTRVARPPTGTREGRGRRKMRSVPAQVAFALRASRVLRSARPSIENRAFELLLRAGFPNRPRQAPSPALLRVRVWKRDSVARAGRAYLPAYLSEGGEGAALGSVHEPEPRVRAHRTPEAQGWQRYLETLEVFSNGRRGLGLCTR